MKEERKAIGTFTVMVKQFVQVGKQVFSTMADYIPEIFIFLLWSVVLFFILSSNALDAKDKFSSCISTTALAVSMYAVRYTLRTQPNVRLAEVKFLEPVHVDSEIPLVFFNSGSILTYLKVVQIQIDKPNLEVVPSMFPMEEIGDRCYCRKSIAIQKKDSSDIQSAVEVRITVNFLFWRNRNSKEGKGIIILDLVPRSQ